MDIFQNPFYILNASHLDNQAKLTDLADEFSLLNDSDESTQALSSLLNPRKRLTAEVAWFPGATQALVKETLTLLKSSPASIFHPKQLRHGGISISISGVLSPVLFELTPVARANVLAASMTRFLHEYLYESSYVTAWLFELARTFENINVEELTVILNMDRNRSGFTEVQDQSAVESEIQTRERHYQDVIRSALDNLPTEELIKVVTNSAELVTDDANKTRLKLIDDMIASYEVEAQSFFDKEEKNIEILVEKIRTMLNEKQADSAVAPIVNQLIQVIKNWNHVAQPVRLCTESSGLSHKSSRDIAHLLREFSVEIFNKYNALTFSQQLVSVLQEIFGEINEISEILANDEEVLNNIHEQRNKTIYETTIGTFFSEKFTISQEELWWKGSKWDINSITRIRWGGMHRQGRVLSSTTYSIYWGNNFELACINSNEKIYLELIEHLWNTIGIRLYIEYLKGLRSGKSYRFASALVSDAGIEMDRRDFFSIKRVFCSWEDIGLSNGNGTFCITCVYNSKLSVSLSYLQDDNVHVLEAMLKELRWKRGGSKLSSLLTTRA